MRLEQLQYLIHIAEVGSITKSAPDLYISQQGLSQAIQQLERELGVQLFERVGNRIVLTEAGEKTIEKAKEILNTYDELIKELRAYSVPYEPLSANELNIYSAPIISLTILPKTLKLLQKKFPYIGIKVKEKQAYEWQVNYDPDFKGREYNPEKARKLLAEAGYPNGLKSTLYCQFLTCGTDTDAVQSYLKDVGIDCNIVTLSVGRWIDMTTNGWEDGLLMAFVGPDSFPAQVDRFWVTPTEPNFWRGLWFETLYRPKEFDELTKMYTKYSTKEALREKGIEIVQVLHDNAIVAPLWEHKDASVMQPYLKTTQPDLYTASLFFQWRLPQSFWLDK